ncbi:hypothetical protein P7K49_035645 [Saguinus oedipus]|uniref:Uncharacterized protein n=1 Tax=Saguinus oedipus TaxID=9490 RepID=A0ABQ9TNU8_SAGOE|nr:hypothetical protein P7K49_035645 [Saguinus oedipus]
MAWSSCTSRPWEGERSTGCGLWRFLLGRFPQPLPLPGSFTPAEESQVPKPPPESPAPPSQPLPPQTLEGLHPAGPEPGGLERAPVQNSPWKETSLDHPYEKPRKSSEPWSESSSPATTPQDGPSASSLWLLEPASYHVVPIRGVPGQWQGRTSAPATPEMQGRRGQSQSLSQVPDSAYRTDAVDDMRLDTVVDSFRAGPEGRGRSAFPRRRPTHYTVTVPDSCFPPTKPPLPHAPHAACHSCSEDSGSDVSSISHPTSPGSSSPDISFLQPLSPPKTHRHRGAWGPAGSRELAAYHPKLLLPPGYFPAGRYVVVAESPLPPGEWEPFSAAPGPAYEDGAPLRYQRLVPSRSRIVRTPSLKDSPAGRGLSKAAVSEELKWWHERARLRSTRPHSLDRQGAFRVRSLPLGREGFGRALGPRTQVPTVCVLRRSPDGAPVQVFVPEKGEIISQTLYPVYALWAPRLLSFELVASQIVASGSPTGDWPMLVLVWPGPWGAGVMGGVVEGGSQILCFRGRVEASTNPVKAPDGLLFSLRSWPLGVTSPRRTGN